MTVKCQIYIGDDDVKIILLILRNALVAGKGCLQHMTECDFACVAR